MPAVPCLAQTRESVRQRLLTATLLGLLAASFLFVAVRWLWRPFFSSLTDALWLVLLLVGPTILISLLVSRFDHWPRWVGGVLAGVLSAGLTALLVPRTPALWIVVALVAAAGGALAAPALDRARGLRVAVFLVVLLTVAGVLAPSPYRAADARRGSTPRLVMIGLDGASWQVIDTMSEAGDLPVMNRIRREGATGVLMSDNPTFSPRVWTTIATAVPSERHGIESFYSTQNEHLKAPRLWEILDAEGFEVGVFRWLVTWPPDPIGQFIVPGWMAPDTATRPEELSFVKDIELTFQTGTSLSDQPLKITSWSRGLLDHGLRFRTVRAVTRWLLTDLLFESREEIRYGAKRRIQLALNWDVFLHLYRHGRPDFAAAVFYGSDTLAHRVWRFAFPRDFGLDPDASRPYGEPLRAYYRDVDAVLGELLDEIDTSTTFMLVSDHGFGSYGGEGELGSELEWEPRISRLADLAGLEIPEQASVAAIARRAYISFHGTSEEVDPVRQRVLAELTALRLVDTGQRLFDLSPTSSGQLGIQVSKGLAVGMLDANDEVAGSDEARHRLGDLLEIEERSGTHTEEGVIMLHGPAIAPGVTIEASLVDVVPTALYLFGLPIGRDMSGRLLEKALRDGQLRERRPAYLATWQERVVISRERTAPSNDEVLEQQLRELGYIE